MARDCRTGRVGVPGEGVKDQDGVAPGRVELTPRLEGDGYLREPTAAFER
jgi:hypothetical protein